MSNRVELPPERALGRRLFALVAIGCAAVSILTTFRSDPDYEDVRLRIDPNLAPRAVLITLPGLGPARVAAIEAARGSSPFRSLDDFDRRVKGIGPATASVLGPHLRFPSPEP